MKRLNVLCALVLCVPILALVLTGASSKSKQGTAPADKGEAYL